MGDYCKSCYYDKKKKYGDKACPFNSLYWHFYERNRNLLSNNQRISMMYQVLNKMASAERQEIFKQAEHYLQTLETL
jgi:deoxyribodipyrimidine photolyase-related protein